MERLPPALEQKRRALARQLGRPVRVRGIRTPDRALRGRLRVDPDRVLIEYQIGEHGYFWHIPIIEELIDRAAAGEIRAEIRDSPGGDLEAPQGL
jgi:hypothetical protein